jgi:hypothetical protein
MIASIAARWCTTGIQTRQGPAETIHREASLIILWRAGTETFISTCAGEELYLFALN